MHVLGAVARDVQRDKIDDLAMPIFGCCAYGIAHPSFPSIFLLHVCPYALSRTNARSTTKAVHEEVIAAEWGKSCR
jgi:hypothetical protein